MFDEAVMWKIKLVSNSISLSLSNDVISVLLINNQSFTNKILYLIIIPNHDQHINNDNKSSA